ncbi:MAG: hypothetical protein M3R38_03980 [Actinomycetota bacterium]|nr:hypothetical protein [Actinomycetota bacterium]
MAGTRKRETEEQKGRRLHRRGRVEFADGSPEGLASFGVRDFDGSDHEVIIDTPFGVVQCDCPQGRPADRLYSSSQCAHAVAASMMRSKMLAKIEAV